MSTLYNEYSSALLIIYSGVPWEESLLPFRITIWLLILLILLDINGTVALMHQHLFINWSSMIGKWLIVYLKAKHKIIVYLNGQHRTFESYRTYNLSCINGLPHAKYDHIIKMILPLSDLVCR